MSDVLEIRVKKSHVAVLSVVVLVASASAAVNVRDPMNVFGDLDMQGNKVVNATEYRFTSSFVREYDENNNGQIEVEELGDAGQDFTSTPQELSLQKLQILGEYFTTGKQISRGVKAAALSEDGKIIATGAYTGTKNGPTQAGNFTFSSDINLQNNNIYNAANLNGGTGGTTGGGGLTIPPYNDISNQRQLRTTYTNNHNGPRLVTVITGSFNKANRLVALVNGGRVQGYGSLDSSSEGLKTVSFLVPQGANYRIKTQGGQDSLLEWYEQDLQGGTGGDGGDEQTGGGGGGSTSNTAPALDWSNARPVKDEVTDGTAEIECNPGEVLRDVTCFKVGRLGGSDAEGDDVLKCDTRTEGSASESAGNAPDISVRPGVSGTCVPVEGVKRQVFSNQNSSNTFQTPPGTSSVKYRVYGGVGGQEGESSDLGGAGGYVEGSIPVDGETTLNVYVGQNGGDGTEPQFTSDIPSTGGRGGCVPFNGVKCGGDGGNGFFTQDPGDSPIPRDGAGGGGAPSMITDSSDQIMVAAGGGGGRSGINGGGGGAGGGTGDDVSGGLFGSSANNGQNADETPRNLGGNAGGVGESPGAGGTFVRSGLPAADSTGTSREGAKVSLSASP